MTLAAAGLLQSLSDGIEGNQGFDPIDSETGDQSGDGRVLISSGDFVSQRHEAHEKSGLTLELSQKVMGGFCRFFVIQFQQNGKSHGGFAQLFDLKKHGKVFEGDGFVHILYVEGVRP